MLLKMSMRMTPRTMTAVPRMSVGVTADNYQQKKSSSEFTELTGADEPAGEEEIENERGRAKRRYPVRAQPAQRQCRTDCAVSAGWLRPTQ
jgi:hypothetical protein